MKNINLYFVLLLSFLFSSCRSDHYKKIMEKTIISKINDLSQSREFDGEVEPPFPDPDKNDETILGIDSNNNGIRDDVDIWINRNAINSNERKSFRQLARMQTEDLKLLSEKKDKEFKENANNLEEAIICYHFVSLGLRRKVPVVEKLNKYTNPFNVTSWLINFSTSKREDAYNRIKYIDYETKSHHGTIFDAWKFCDFEIENLEAAKNLHRD